MIREEMKKMLPIIQAYVDGKVVEYQEAETGEWRAVEDCKILITVDDKPRHYRIKPESKYRSFNSKKECWDEMLKHTPFGWVKDRKLGSLVLTDIIYNSDAYFDICINDSNYLFDEAFERFRFADDKPFGIKEE